MLTLAPIETAIQISEAAAWIDVCHMNDILPSAGVAALVAGKQIAIFRVESAPGAGYYAIGNYDPFSRAYVLARGLVGDKNGVLKVTSPIYKHPFNLQTGQCLDDESVVLDTWPVRVVDGIVQIEIRA